MDQDFWGVDSMVFEINFYEEHSCDTHFLSL